MNHFGISTHLYHNERLSKGHLAELASHGFDVVELFATRSHFDYRDRRAIDALADWLGEHNLRMHSVHAPITDVFANDKAGRMYSIASRDGDARREAVGEITAALEIASVIPFSYLVVHAGVPAQDRGGDDNHREAAIRSLEEICAVTDPLGITIAVEVIPNRLSTPSGLLELLESAFAESDLGVCMDVGHAHLLGDTGEAIETLSEYLLTTHIHDNRRSADDHLVPFQGTINWPSTLMAFRKIGYDGVLMYEVRNADAPAAVLSRAARARTRLESLMADDDRLH